jgi:uncharacterized protein HemY
LRSLAGQTTIAEVEEIGSRETLNPELSTLLAQDLLKNKYEESALKIIRNTVKNYPDNYFAWKLFTVIPSATPEEIAQAQMQMKRLDPLNPELK